MKTGIEGSYYLNKQTGITDYEAMKRHGFDCVDYGRLCDTTTELYSMDDDAFCKLMQEEKERADKAGIKIFQIHGPWPVDDTAEEKTKQNMEFMKRAVLGASVLGKAYLVVHPVMPYGWNKEEDAEYARRVNKEFFTELCEFAKPYGVTVCIENMPFPNCKLSYMEALADFVNELDIDNFKICLDTGHSNVCKEAPGEMIRKYSSLIKTLHLHDNRGWTDEHAMPYTHDIDWSDFKKAIKETGFEGCLSLEIHGPKQYCPDDIKEEMLKTACKIAKSLG